MHLRVVFVIALLGLGCMRSGPSQSQRSLCGEGQQIVMASTLFCVYVDPEEPVDCGAELPFRHQVEDTVICSFDAAPDPVLLAAVFEATALPPLIDGLLGFVFGDNALDGTARDTAEDAGGDLAVPMAEDVRDGAFIEMSGDAGLGP